MILKLRYSTMAAAAAIISAFCRSDGQAPTLAQGNVVGGPIRHSVPLLRDVMTAILVRFEWHGDCPGSGTGPSSYTVHLSSPTTDPCNKVGPREIARTDIAIS